MTSICFIKFILVSMMMSSFITSLSAQTGCYCCDTSMPACSDTDSIVYEPSTATTPYSPYTCGCMSTAGTLVLPVCQSPYIVGDLNYCPDDTSVSTFNAELLTFEGISAYYVQNTNIDNLNYDQTSGISTTNNLACMVLANNDAAYFWVYGDDSSPSCFPKQGILDTSDQKGGTAFNRGILQYNYYVDQGPPYDLVLGNSSNYSTLASCSESCVSIAYCMWVTFKYGICYYRCSYGGYAATATNNNGYFTPSIGWLASQYSPPPSTSVLSYSPPPPPPPSTAIPLQSPIAVELLAAGVAAALAWWWCS